MRTCSTTRSAWAWRSPDPTADVEGYDAAYKLSILSSLAFHAHVPVEKVFREGITRVTPLDIACGQEMGLTLKLLAVAKRSGDGWRRGYTRPLCPARTRWPRCRMRSTRSSSRDTLAAR